MNKVEEIFRAWSIAFNPDDEQAELAVKRIQICDKCEHKDKYPTGPLLYIAKCGVCGCALKGKIYTPKTYLDEGGSCPKEKWKDVEKEWLDKKNNTVK